MKNFGHWLLVLDRVLVHIMYLAACYVYAVEQGYYADLYLASKAVLPYLLGIILLLWLVAAVIGNEHASLFQE